MRRAERPLFCAVIKTGGVTGEKLSDKAVAPLIKQATADNGGLDADKFFGHSPRRSLLPPGPTTRPSSPTSCATPATAPPRACSAISSPPISGATM